MKEETMKEIMGNNREVNTCKMLGLTVLELSDLISKQLWVTSVTAYHI
jgi:hypothetical protein